jgi:hypothetical protein
MAYRIAGKRHIGGGFHRPAAKHAAGHSEGLAGIIGIPLVLNLNRQNTTKIRAGYAAMKAGTRNMSVAIMGDSTDRGVDETASPYNLQYTNSLAEYLAAQLRAEGIPAGANNWYGISGTSLTDYKNRDGRLTTAGTAAMGSSVIQGGAGLSMSSATAAMTFTPQGQWKVAEIFTMQNSAFNGATLASNIDGGANTNIVQDATNTIRKTLLTATTLGTHTVNIAWASGANALYGINCYDDSRKEVTIHQWAQSGGTLSQMVDDTGTPSAGRIRQMTLFPVDLVLGDGGMVNTWRNNISVATAQTQFDAWIDAVKNAGADFIWCVPPFDTGVAGNTANQQQYIDMGYARCLVKNVPIFDIRKRWQSKTAADAAGYMSAADATHPRAAGQLDRAIWFKPILKYGMGV